MDHFNLKNDLSFKLNIVYFATLNNYIKINNDPIPYLLKDFSEIEPFLEINNLTKILYFNIKKIHKILYDCDKIIHIKDKMSNNNLSFNYYLSLLIVADSEIINYEFSAN